MTTTGVLVVSTATATKEAAVELAKTAVQARLAASAQIHGRAKNDVDGQTAFQAAGDPRTPVHTPIPAPRNEIPT